MKILRLKQVTAMTGLARSTIYKYVSAGTFPNPYRLAAALWGGLKPSCTSGLQKELKTATFITTR